MHSIRGNVMNNNSPNGHTAISIHATNGHKSQENEPEKDFYPDELKGKLKEDVIARYFRCRWADRDSFKRGLSSGERALIDDEEQRLLHIRAKLQGDLGDLTAIQALHTYRREWKEHARERSGDALKTVPQKFRELKERLKKQAPTRPLPEDVIAKRITNERRILGNVKEWESIPLLAPHISFPENPEANPQLEVRVMTLKEYRREEVDQAAYFKLDGKMEKHHIDKILGEGGSKILKPAEPTEPNQPSTIRYFHLPANNMGWIEQVMANYYDSRDCGKYDDRTSKFYRKGASNVLRREFWKGQQHGSNADPIHARHLRPKFSAIPPDKGSPHSVKNFALFMPFLHWEMSKRRARMAALMKEYAKKERKRKLEAAEFEPGQFERRDLFDVYKTLKIKRAAVSKFPGSKASSRLNLNALSPWGKYMLQIAKVVDMMDCELDERLLREDLFKKSPLHPRRTLDQSYHWKLENTARRDQDQVVYRGTEGRFRSRQVVMVDQLWMWILDEHTIITAYPRRWGRNKPDPSGVHRSIRDRLDDLQDGDITSVYDLASLIIDQCSRVFFDRTKPVDERPEVLDIFANAIANVSEQSTNAFEEFWSHMLNLNKMSDKQSANAFKNIWKHTAILYKKISDKPSTKAFKEFWSHVFNFNENTSDKNNDQEAKANYFNINAEGLLLREAHDISEELKMMQRVYDQQIHVVKEYNKALSRVSNQVRSTESASHVEIRTNSPDGNNVEEKNIVESRKERGKSPERRNHVPKESITRANDLLEELEARKLELEDLDRAAKDVSDELNQLLSLKQQQASALGADAALRRAEESVSQGRSIMVFTIVTIVFLPLGFMSSIFGMNNTTFANNPVDLNFQLKYMFTISLGVILVSLGLAFTKWWLLPSLLSSYSLHKSSKRRGPSKQEKQIFAEERRSRAGTDHNQDESGGSGEHNGSFLHRLRERREGSFV